MTATILYFKMRCLTCDHLGTRVFTPATADGKMRDALGGDKGVQPEHCVCDCGSRRYRMERVEL